MNLNIYSFYDTKAGMFNVPFFLPTDGMAVRAAIDLGEDLNSRIGRHPEDFVLYRIGVFDDSNATVVSRAPESLGPVASMLSPRASNGGLFGHEDAKRGATPVQSSPSRGDSAL